MFCWVLKPNSADATQFLYAAPLPACKLCRQPESHQRRASAALIVAQGKRRITIRRQESGDSPALSLITFFGASKESNTAGRPGPAKLMLQFMIGSSLLLQPQPEPAGRVPPDAFLFVQAATKRKQKVPATAWSISVEKRRRRFITFTASDNGGTFFAALLFTKAAH